MKNALGLLAAVVVTCAVGIVAVWSGVFNVAATDPHSAVTTWLLDTTMRRSVAVHSSSIVAPKSYTEAQVEKGFEEYAEMCVTCHGAPGRERSSIGKGLAPRPPKLTVAAQHWNDAELFWIVKNGIKMTGMPAFGPTHDEDTLWSIVAFVRQLPDMTAEQYQQLSDKAAGTGDAGHGSGEGHAH